MFVRLSSLVSVMKVWSTLWSTRAMLLVNRGMTKGSAGTDSQHCQRFACAPCVHIQKWILNVCSDGKNLFFFRFAGWRAFGDGDQASWTISLHISCCLFGHRRWPLRYDVFFHPGSWKFWGWTHMSRITCCCYWGLKCIRRCVFTSWQVVVAYSDQGPSRCSAFAAVARVVKSWLLSVAMPTRKSLKLTWSPEGSI